ncbi:hypothetical protein QAD02_010515 [Eretmocerus hayati]|uniref:Uncharacterized protein n=1 Tax=Eretmocerus hayati TaxID=131215 RepID=A0ACC2NUG5_9HYME|nr:hypothetical protein QAD02_010515 [Eretmocerus hayati]
MEILISEDIISFGGLDECLYKFTFNIGPIMTYVEDLEVIVANARVKVGKMKEKKVYIQESLTVKSVKSEQVRQEIEKKWEEKRNLIKKLQECEKDISSRLSTWEGMQEEIGAMRMQLNEVDSQIEDKCHALDFQLKQSERVTRRILLQQIQNLDHFCKNTKQDIQAWKSQDSSSSQKEFDGEHVLHILL